MVSRIKQFFERYVSSPAGETDTVSEHSLMIATAALLLEMMRADACVSAEERETVLKTIRTRFRLSEEETDALMALAEEEINRATGYFEFTSLINRGLTYDQKIHLIEYLWEVAFSDSILDKYEEYMVRKIANLIYVSHPDFINAKLRAKKRLGV